MFHCFRSAQILVLDCDEKAQILFEFDLYMYTVELLKVTVLYTRMNERKLYDIDTDLSSLRTNGDTE